jgi:asparagine synthase (glutamine-hydrolysing)
LAGVIASLTPQRWDSLYGYCEHLLPATLRHRMPGYKLHKLSWILKSQNDRSAYGELSSHWTDPTKIALGSREPETILSTEDGWANLPTLAEQMMCMDTVTYLPDDILTKVDRATMSASLEARVPYLDHRLVEFAWRLPLAMKLQGGKGKAILRRVLHRHVPQELVDRPKTGFGIPLDLWLRGPLRDWAEALLSEQRLRSEGYLDPGPIRKLWGAHLSGQGAWQYHLWDVLMFQAWLQANQRCPVGEVSVAMTVS